MKRISFLSSAIVVCVLLMTVGETGPSWGADRDLSQGQTVYVSIYSHIYYGDRTKPFNLAAMLSIRNTDPNYPLTVVAANYYDSAGSLVKDYIAKPVSLGPLASTYIYVKESDTTGGSGANFIVSWKSDRRINTPIIESVMIGVASGQGISFVCPGQELEEHP